MDPWNIDVAKLADMYLRAIKEFKQMDIKVSGKFILAAAILLKMKSDYLFPRAAGEIPIDNRHYLLWKCLILRLNQDCRFQSKGK
jgi:chromatin segregation and condensation protein Rec8/ScpA/Scc1 (kleisin family)